jgi:hypothetical protein
MNNIVTLIHTSSSNMTLIQTSTNNSRMHGQAETTDPLQTETVIKAAIKDTRTGRGSPHPRTIPGGAILTRI